MTLSDFEESPLWQAMKERHGWSTAMLQRIEPSYRSLMAELEGIEDVSRREAIIQRRIGEFLTGEGFSPQEVEFYRRDISFFNVILPKKVIDALYVYWAFAADLSGKE